MSRSQSFNISLKLLTAQFNKGLKNVQKQIRAFGNYIKSAFALGTVTMFGRKVVEVGADFEDAMARVQAVSNATTMEFKTMANEAKRLGATTRYSASEAANALEMLTRNGLSASDATRALEGTLQLAGANAVDLATAADIATNTLNAFGLGVSQLSRVNDVLAATAAHSATNINDLYEAMVVAGPYSKIMGKSIEETAAALGVLANNGVKGSSSGKALAAMYQRLASQSPKAQKALAKFGVTVSEDQIKSQSLIDTLKQLEKSGIGNSVEALSEIFGKNFAGTISLLINNVNDLDAMLNVMANSAGTAERMFKQGIGSTKNELATLRSMYEDFLITLSEKTRGVVNGTIKVLQGLIANFKTIGGTIANIASVAVPLLGKKIASLVKSFKTLFTVIKTEGAAATAAMGGWITAIASLVTWVGTALVGAYNKAHQAMRNAKKEMSAVSIENQRLADKTDMLISRLKTDGANSLLGVVREACDMFPDFADEIKNAAKEASDSVGSYDVLITKLKEIRSLQATVASNQSMQKMYNANLEAGARRIRTSTKSEKEAAGLGELQNFFDKNKKQYTKELQDAIYQSILEMRVNGFSSKDIGKYISDITGETNASFNHNAIKGLSSYVGAARTYNQKIRENNELIDEAEAKRAAAKFRKELEQSAIELGVKFTEAMSDADLQKAINKKTSGGGGAEDDKASKKASEIKNDLNDSLTSIKDDLNNNWIDSKTALNNLIEAYRNAYEDLRKLTGRTGTDNEYFDTYNNLRNGNIGVRGALGMSEAELIPKVANTISSVATSQNANGINLEGLPAQPINLDNTQLDRAVAQMDAFNSLASESTNIISNMSNAFKTLNDDEATWTDKLAASMSIMQSMSDTLDTINTLTKIGTVLTAGQAKVEGEVANAKMASAIASIFKGNGEIPIAGIAISAAGVAALMTALASAPKFANGGIVQGSLHGDRNFARVNGGEIILNGNQQKKLWNLINDGATSGKTQKLELVVKGKDLVGAINNYNTSTSKITTKL